MGFVGSIATLALAAGVLGATSLGDLFGRKRLYVWGLIGKAQRETADLREVVVGR